MKYCYQCGRVTSGKPLFCGSCGRSYDTKLCPRMHPNPRYADCCSQCGSRELSTPQPRVPLWWRAFVFLVQVVSGIFLVLLSLTVFVGVLRTREVQNGILVTGFFIALLWWLWSVLPDWFRKLIRRLMKRKERRNER